MNPALEMKDNFQKELHSLYQELDKKLIEVDSSTRNRDHNRSDFNDSVEKLNKLKIHRMKVRAAWEWLKRASEQEWFNRKDQLQKKYEDAAKLIH